MPLPRTRGQRGAAAVEFALVLPLLLTLVLGTIDWGYYFFIRETVVNAAREGARAGTLILGGDSGVAEATAKSYLSSAGLTKTATIKGTTLATPSGDLAVEVDVSYPVGSLTGFLGAFLPLTANATAVMRL